jgi:hypothetical protein
VSLTREVKSNGFDLYAIPALRSASDEDVAALRRSLAAVPGLSVVARHEREGAAQDIITAAP